MADPGEPNASEESYAVTERRRALSGTKTGGGLRRGLAGIVIVVLLVLAAALLFSDQLAELFGWQTSDSEDMQRTSDVDVGLSTIITNELPNQIEIEDTPDLIEIPADDSVLPQADIAVSGDGERFDAIERTLNQLAQQLAATQIGEAERAALLDAQAAELRAEFERERDMLTRRHEAELAAARAAAASSPTGPTDEELAEAAARERAEQARLRAEAIRMEQINSDANVFDESTPRPGTGGVGETDDVRELTGNEQFLRSATQAGVLSAIASQLDAPSRTIVQGTMIPGILETAINTELPGLIRAVVSEDVYSFDGSNVLMPSGTRLIGEYNADISLAQSRVLIAWTRAITPGGQSVQLGSVGADALGRSGQSGDVDSRFTERFGSAALISLIGAVPVAIADLSGSSDTTNGFAQDLATDSRTATQPITDEYLRLPPVIQIEQGTRMTVFVNRDLIF